MQLNTEAIKKIMDKKKIKATDLARTLGKRESWVYSMLQGNEGKTMRIAEEIAEALNCRESQIIIYGKVSQEKK